MSDWAERIASDALDMLDYAMKQGDAIAVYRVIKERGYVIPVLEADGVARPLESDPLRGQIGVNPDTDGGNDALD